MISTAAEPRTQSAVSDRQHLAYLDGLRAIAALFVILHHTYLEAWPVVYGRKPHGFLRAALGWLWYGHFAVDVFIVLSGFCLMLPIVYGNGTLRGGSLAFFKRRARRILPPYYAAMAFALALIALCIGHKTGSHWDLSVPITVRGVILHLLLLNDITSNSEINHVFWSIAVEWKIYFLFPLLVLARRRWGTLPMAVLTALIASALVQAVRGTPLAGITPQYLALFGLGMLGADITYGSDSRLALLRRIPWPAVAIIPIVDVADRCFRWDYETYQDHLPLLDFRVGMISMCLLIAAARHERLRTLLSWRPLVFLGTFAYSLYLVHAPLIQVAWQYIVHPLHLDAGKTFLMTAAIAVPLSIGAAYLFFLAFERPFLSSRHRSTPADDARDAALSPAP